MAKLNYSPSEVADSILSSACASHNVTRTQSSCENVSQRSAESRGFSPGTPVSFHM